MKLLAVAFLSILLLLAPLASLALELVRLLRAREAVSTKRGQLRGTHGDNASWGLPAS